MIKTVITPEGCFSIVMTEAEITARQIEEIAAATRKIETDKDEARFAALSTRWEDSFDLLDDILEFGITVVKEERDAIKALYPKGEE